MGFYHSSAKRTLDLVLGTILLILLAPVLTALGLLILLVDGRPVLFVQTRPGLHGVPFRLVKFRTMSESRDRNGHLRPDAARLTRLGAFLRTTSLDELPELWNVLKGDMSLVGPRPLLMQYLAHYTPTQQRRHQVRPGITGWAQVNGRNALTWEERFELDVWYVDNLSVWLDLKVLVKTVGFVIRREGISARDHATMPPFTGSTSPDGGETGRGRSTLMRRDAT